MTIEELEEFFATHPIPPGTKQNQAVTIVGPKKFLEVNLAAVRAWEKDLNKCPSHWHLCELVDVLSGKTQVENPKT